MKEIRIEPPLETSTRGGMLAVVEYFRPGDAIDRFRGTVAIDEFGTQREVLWGSGGICRDSHESFNLTKDSPGFVMLRARFIRI
jgi:hypothetical protein